MLSDSTVTIEHKGDLAWVVVNNPPVNATSTGLRAGLLDAVARVQGARLAVLRCAGRTFIAGGDMSEFDAPPMEPHLPDVVQAIEESETPFLALMHGKALGGGLEIAMACAWRIAAPETGFGLPEVKVGLIPGAGGTQRLPRLIGMEAALDMACFGKILKAKEMLALGGIDLIADGDLEAAAEGFAVDLPDRPISVSIRPVMALPPETVDARRAEIARRTHEQIAPLENFEAVMMSTLPFPEAQPRERAKHLELRQSGQSRALRYAFFAERSVSRPEIVKGVSARDITRVAVVGGGLMGAGIATALLNAGLSVTIIEQSDSAADAAKTRVKTLLNGALKRGKARPEQVSDRLGRLSVSPEYASAASAELAIEAVFEDLSAKQDVFRKLADVMAPGAILATNTSYLDPQQIFDGIANPERCLGLHFFSPAHVMKLLEIVRLPDSSADVLASGFALARKLRKMPVLAGNCDGFIGNRMLAAYRREADYLLADGALPHQIDAAMRAFGMPLGPYELQDLTGLQIAWANRKRQAATRPATERYVDIADRLCEMERFGQRSGKGWYLYEEGHRKPVRDRAIEAMIEQYSADEGITRQDFSAEEIAARILAVLANEGARIVEDGIADSDEAADVVQLHGYGFPRWRGGPMHHAAATGWQETAGIMARVAAQSTGSWQVSERLKPETASTN